MVEAKPSTDKEIEELTIERETKYRILLGEEEENQDSMSEGDQGSQEEQKEDDEEQQDGDREMTHDPDAPKDQVNLIDAELIRLQDTFGQFMSEIPGKYEPERQQITERLERCNQGKRTLQNILGGATAQEEEDEQMEDEVSEQVSIATIVT